MSQNKGSFSASVGARLQAALTNEQIRTVLNAVAEAGHLRAIDDRLRAADPDLADTLRRILQEPCIHPLAAASSEKTLEKWAELWAVWTDHVAEVGDEQGSYANQEEHWHPPYLDHNALAADLEEAAGQLSEWIDRAFPLVNQPDLFLESVAEIDRNAQSLPDWFQPIEDNFVLRPRASSCVLRWTWLALANKTGRGRNLVDLLCGLEVPEKGVELDQDACCQFFRAYLKAYAGTSMPTFMSLNLLKNYQTADPCGIGFSMNLTGDLILPPTCELAKNTWNRIGITVSR